MEELEKFFLILKDFSSPIYLIVLFTLFLAIAVFQIFITIIIPRNKAHKKEKEELLSLFAKLDPDPLIRFDKNGSIIISNDSALKIFRSSFSGVTIQQLFRSIKESPARLIKKNIPFIFNESIHDRHYSITLKPIPSLGVGQLYFKDITDNIISENKQLEYQKMLKDYTDNLHTYIEDEKFRIARDLHDSIGQKLLLLKLKLQKVLEPGGPYENEINVSLEDAIKELREIIYNLKPKILEELGLAAALNTLCERISAESGITGKFELLGSQERYDHKTELFLFRIAQEALNNIVKHSKATVFNIQLIDSGTGIKLIVSDNGAGFDPQTFLSYTASHNGFGLRNIREKVEKYSGTLRVNSFPGEGTILLVQFNKGITGGYKK